jgi:hypothetical protein
MTVRFERRYSKNGAASKRTNKRNIAKAGRCDKAHNPEQGL